MKIIIVNNFNFNLYSIYDIAFDVLINFEEKVIRKNFEKNSDLVLVIFKEKSQLEFFEREFNKMCFLFENESNLYFTNTIAIKPNHNITLKIKLKNLRMLEVKNFSKSFSYIFAQISILKDIVLLFTNSQLQKIISNINIKENLSKLTEVFLEEDGTLKKIKSVNHHDLFIVKKLKKNMSEIIACYSLLKEIKIKDEVYKKSRKILHGSYNRYLKRYALDYKGLTLSSNIVVFNRSKSLNPDKKKIRMSYLEIMELALYVESEMYKKNSIFLLLISRAFVSDNFKVQIDKILESCDQVWLKSLTFYKELYKNNMKIFIDDTFFKAVDNEFKKISEEFFMMVERGNDILNSLVSGKEIENINFLNMTNIINERYVELMTSDILSLPDSRDVNFFNQREEPLLFYIQNITRQEEQTQIENLNQNLNLFNGNNEHNGNNEKNENKSNNNNKNNSSKFVFE